jgi:hypothetical protein
VTEGVLQGGVSVSSRLGHHVCLIAPAYFKSFIKRLADKVFAVWCSLLCGDTEHLSQSDQKVYHDARTDTGIFDVDVAAQTVDKIAGGPQSETPAFRRRQRRWNILMEQGGHILG